MFKRVMSAAVAVLAACVVQAVGPAHAAEPWSGFYIGGAGGYLWGTIDGAAHTDIPGLPSEDYLTSASDQNWLVSGLIGLDARSGNHVIGVFADYTWHGDFSSDVSTDFGGGFYKEFAAQFNDIATVAVRLGIVHATNSLLYGLAGWSWATGSLYEFEGCHFCDDLEYSGHVKANGVTLGAGIEHMFGPHVSGRVEYRWTHLESGDISGLCTPQVGGCGRAYYGTASADADIHSVRAALVLWFGQH